MTHRVTEVYKVIIPGLIGNILEWYDFALYGYFSSIIAPLFFPANNKTSSYIATYSVFAIGFIMRPLGAIIFGFFGDRYGRKNALSTAILLMAIPTTLIGCLPGFEDIGLWAPALLSICRLLQGLAVGGEFTGSIVYIIEHAPKDQRGFFGSLAMASAFIGLLIGSMTSLIVHQYFNEVSYAWRIPFIASLLLGGVGLYLRLGMPESPIFKQFILKHSVNKHPLKTVLSQHYFKLVKAMALVMLPSTGFYLSFIYLPIYIKEFLHLSMVGAMQINTISMVCIIITIPFFGWLSDLKGRKFVLALGGAGFLLFSIPLYALLQVGGIAYIYFCMLSFALFVALSYATIPVVLVEMFPVDIRFTGMSLPYNLANALFGGTAPLVASQLIVLSGGNLFMPGIYLCLLAAITCIVISKMPSKLLRDLL